MKDRNEILAIVKGAVAETFDLQEEITNDNLSFKEDLEADSIDLVSLVLVLEEEFSAEIDESEVDNFATINDVVNYIMTNKNA